MRFVAVINFWILGMVIISGQNPENYVNISGVIEYRGAPLENVNIVITTGGAKVHSVYTPQNGEFDFVLDYNKEYTIELSKRGMVTKRIVINTLMPPGIKGGWGAGFPVDLYPFCKGIDLSVFNDPITIIRFNPKIKEFESDEEYFRDMQARIDVFIDANERCLDNEYKSQLAQADKFFKEKKYEEARQAYVNASIMRPDDPYPPAQLTKIDQQIAREGASQELYKKLIAEADNNLSSGNLLAAKEAYKRASAINTSETYPRTKITEIDQRINSEKVGLDAQSQAEAKYKGLISQADKALIDKNFASATNLYGQALQAKPGDTYATTKKAESERLLAQTNQQLQADKVKDQSYQSAFAEGEKFLMTNELTKAREAFLRAQSIKPGDGASKQKIDDIDRRIDLANRQDIANKQKEQETLFNNYLTEGDNYLKAKNFEQSAKAYREALKIKPSDVYAKSKLSSAEKGISQTAEAEAARKREAELIAQKAEADRIAREKEAQLLAQKAAEAEAARKREAELAAQRAAADKAAADKAAADKAARERELQLAYQKALTDGDGFLAKKDYTMAKAAYTKALTLVPADAVAKGKIDGVDRQVAAEAEAARKREAELAAQRAAADKAAADKAAADKAAADKAARERELQLAYQKALTDGDGFLAKKDYTMAKAAYTKALTLVPADAVAKGKIDGVDRQVAAEAEAARKQEAELAAQRAAADKAAADKAAADKAAADKAARERELQLAYQKALADGDGFLAKKDYTMAKAAYTKALTLVPGDAIAQGKIDGVDRQVAAEAEAVRKREAELAAQRAAADKAAADKAAEDKRRNDQYTAAIGRADGFMKSRQWEQAKLEYNNALAIKPSDTYATGKVAEADKAILALRQEQQRKQQLEEEYRSFVNQGDSHMAQDNLEEAKSAYNEALVKKPADTYASNQIKKIDQQLTERQKMAVAEKQRQEDYKKSLAAADNLYTSGDYTGAKANYQKALAIIPNSVYAKERIKQIDGVLAQMQARQSGAKPVKPVAVDTKLENLVFENNSERDVYLADLKRKYPAGVTVEVYREQYRTIRRFVIVRNDVANEFREIKHSWGGIDYWMNDKPVTSQYFESQVKKREGEYYNVEEK